MRSRLPLWGLLTLSACATAADPVDEAGVAPAGELAEPTIDDDDPLLEVEGPVGDEAAAPFLATAVATCGASKLAEILAPATADARAATVDCNLTLRPEDVVTKQLILQGPAASGVTVACNGALLDGGEGKVNEGRDMIEVRSKKSTDAAGAAIWQRPENITIRDCRIDGSLRIWGMGKNGEAEDVRDSSRRADHVTRVRANAPRRITLDNLTIRGVGRTPVYLSPGVTEVTLESSELTGEATSAGLYLDAESARNVIRGNYLHVTSRKEYVGGIYTQKREEIAIDGSSFNLIVDNRLSSLEGGGIYLYRNCGEGGTVRHSQPSYNQIINNVFYYREYDGDNPSVFIGSRDNSFWEGRWYCGDDDGYAWGSSADNRSFAHHTVVMQNQITVRSVSDMIQQGDSSNSPSFLAANETVTSERQRLAGCYVAAGYKNFILDGESLDVYRGADGAPRCTGFRDVCSDGTLARSAWSACSVARQVTDCQVSGSNAGCSRTAACPAGTRIVGASAACNLESGAVTDAQLAAVAGGTIQVVRASDNVSDGRCALGATRVSSGAAKVAGVVDAASATMSCREVDQNGGDCDIKAALYCR